ncbi:glycosyl hydrolase family 43 [Opitutaceae bacterium TAV5]|nr:glycosyl hydrolase family 43 [Opitutaceae bacterium TAV5]
MNTLFHFGEIADDNGFRMEGYWLWCPSVIRGPEGRWHMFASRWPAWLPMHPGWLTHSEVMRATADNPEGPYAFAEVVLPARGPEYWDGRATHNPTIRFHGGRYYLFYTGITWPLPPPKPGETPGTRDPLCIVARAAKRVGVAWADSLEGPWHRSEQPLLPTRPGTFYSFLTSNPAPWIMPDGRVMMLFKSREYRANGSHSDMHIGLAEADSPASPFRVVGDGPVFDEFGEVEDPFFWHDGEVFHAVAKDMSGTLAGQPGAGVHAVSDDGRRWRPGTPQVAWRKEIVRAGGVREQIGSLERPFLLMNEAGIPTHLCAAVSNGSSGFTDASVTQNRVISLES